MGSKRPRSTGGARSHRAAFTLWLRRRRAANFHRDWRTLGSDSRTGPAAGAAGPQQASSTGESRLARRTKDQIPRTNFRSWVLVLGSWFLETGSSLLGEGA